MKKPTSVSLRFYEKPGCISNNKQKLILREAGFGLEVCNLLTTPWTSTTLMPFLEGNPVTDWFNPSAPAIKMGELIPSLLSAGEALTILLANHLLIRRPLIQAGDVYLQGFDLAALYRRLNIAPAETIMVPDNIEACSATIQKASPPLKMENL